MFKYDSISTFIYIFIKLIRCQNGIKVSLPAAFDGLLTLKCHPILTAEQTLRV